MSEVKLSKRKALDPGIKKKMHDGVMEILLKPLVTHVVFTFQQDAPGSGFKDTKTKLTSL